MKQITAVVSSEITSCVAGQQKQGLMHEVMAAMFLFCTNVLAGLRGQVNNQLNATYAFTMTSFISLADIVMKSRSAHHM